MADIFQQLYSINIVNYVGVEDFADRLSFLYTVTLISFCCALTTTMSYVLHPIACYMPNTFGEFFDGKELFGQIEYATNFCWTEGTYAVHPSNFSVDAGAIDGGLGAYADKKIVYYQWVPFLLALQGVMTYLPRLLWHCISYDRAGTDVGHIVKVASDASREEEEAHDKLVTYACRMIQVMLDRVDCSRGGAACSGGEAQESQFVRAKNACWKCLSIAMPSRLSGSGLILTYLLIKLAYLINAVSQLAIMQHFLRLNSDSRYNLLGVSLLGDILAGRDWQNSMAFPRVGCCAVYFRSAAGGNWQFSQCALPVNIINEKVYIFLWFWFVFLAAATVASMATWLYRLVNATLTCGFVKKYLRLADNYQELKNRKAITRGFLNQFLRRDGAFVLKMIALNAGDVVCAEIIQQLWRQHLAVKGFDAAAAAAAASTTAAVAYAASDTDDEAAPQPKPEAGVLRLSINQMPLNKAEGSNNRSRRKMSAPVRDMGQRSADSFAARKISVPVQQTAAAAAAVAAATAASSTPDSNRTIRVRRDISFYVNDSGSDLQGTSKTDVVEQDVTSL